MTDDDLTQRIRQAIADEGHWETVDQLRKMVAFPRLMKLVRMDASGIKTLLQEQDALVENIRRSITEFSSWGWASSGSVHAEGYARGIEALDGGASRDLVESMIASTWEDRHKLRRPALQIGSLFAPDHELFEVCEVREALLLKAAKHHRKGRYEASVPIVLANIEGVVADVTGKLFFSADDRRRAEIVEDTAIATMSEGLPIVRRVFSSGQKFSTPEDGVSRHGILHGRTLGYATQITSLKSFALLQAVVEWLQPLARNSEQ